MSDAEHEVKDCDSCPMESMGGCQHPRAVGDQKHIGSTTLGPDSPPLWCPLRARPLQLRLAPKYDFDPDPEVS